MPIIMYEFLRCGIELDEVKIIDVYKLMVACRDLGYISGAVFEPTFGLGRFWTLWRPDDFTELINILDRVSFSAAKRKVYLNGF